MITKIIITDLPDNMIVIDNDNNKFGLLFEIVTVLIVTSNESYSDCEILGILLELEVNENHKTGVDGDF